jgi:hypothetical protein
MKMETRYNRVRFDSSKEKSTNLFCPQNKTLKRPEKILILRKELKNSNDSDITKAIL